MTSDAQIERALHQTWMQLADAPQDPIRLAVIAEYMDVPNADRDRVLLDMIRRGGVHAAPCANRKTHTQQDHDAAIRIGGEDKHLLIFEEDYLPGY